MGIQFDWAILEKVGIAGICLALIYFGYKLFELFMTQWKNSTDAVNKNTEAFTKLSGVFEKSYEREVEFQNEMRERMKDTQKKVAEIHNKVV